MSASLWIQIFECGPARPPFHLLECRRFQGYWRRIGFSVGTDGKSFPNSGLIVGELLYSSLSFRRFHSRSKSSSINRSISWWFLTVSRTRSSHCRGTNSWRNFSLAVEPSRDRHGDLRGHNDSSFAAANVAE